VTDGAVRSQRGGSSGTPEQRYPPYPDAASGRASNVLDRHEVMTDDEFFPGYLSDVTPQPDEAATRSDKREAAMKLWWSR
jgi:hypothetical protein